MLASNLQLEYAFNPNSYINRYSNMKSNVYLGMCVGQDESHGKFPVKKRDENLNPSASNSVKYIASKFNNLGSSYRSFNDNKVRVIDSDRILNKDLMNTVGAVSLSLAQSSPFLSKKPNTLNSHNWPLYESSPVRSVCRFLEVNLLQNRCLFAFNFID